MAFPEEQDELATAVGEALLARGARIAVAESTAGGLISLRLLSVPGASRWFERGVVAYSGQAKVDALGVDRDLLREHGAVSAISVTAMAESIRHRAGVEYAVAESGIAGPLGSHRSPKPVGSVVIAVAGPAGTKSAELRFDGSRAQVMQEIARTCLEMILGELR